MSARIILIVNLEQPHVHIQIVCDEPSQGQLEFLPLCDVVSGNRNWNVAQLEDALGSTFRRKDYIASLEVWFATHDRNAQLDGQLDVVVAHFSRHNVRLLILDQVLDLSKCFGREKHGLGQREVFLEFDVILWYNQVETLSRLLNFDQLQYFQVVLVHFTRERVGADIDHVHVGVFD